jgi:hypothetical protein
MKKIIFLLLLLPLFSFSQVSNDSNTVIQPETPNQIKPQIQNELISTNYTNSRDYYCEIVGIGKLLSSKVTVEIDFGEHRKFFEDSRLKDANGNLIVFNSMIDALNFMGGLGWKLHSTMVISGQYGSVYHYVLVKNTPAEEEK